VAAVAQAAFPNERKSFWILPPNPLIRRSLLTTSSSLGQGERPMSSDLERRIALLSLVFLTDLIVFVGLCRQEFRDWRAQRSATRDAFTFAQAASPTAEGAVS